VKNAVKASASGSLPDAFWSWLGCIIFVLIILIVMLAPLMPALALYASQPEASPWVKVVYWCLVVGCATVTLGPWLYRIIQPILSLALVLVEIVVWSMAAAFRWLIGGSWDDCECEGNVAPTVLVLRGLAVGLIVGIPVWTILCMTTSAARAMDLARPIAFAIGLWSVLMSLKTL
jgi:hypothetical protein